MDEALNSHSSNKKQKEDNNSFYLEAGTETNAFAIAAFSGAPLTNDDQQGTSFGRL